MGKYKGIIFDLDGTLLDTIQDISDSANEVLTLYGYPNFSYDEYKLKVGDGLKNLFRNSVPDGIDDNTFEEAYRLFLKTYNKNYQNKTIPYKGIVEMLEEIDKMGIKIGINSNKKNEYTYKLAIKFFIRVPFIAIFGERNDIPRKPDPTAAKEILKDMDLQPEEVLYVGDSKTDIMTATNAGMDGMGVLWGFRSFEELNKYGAKYIVSNPEEIVNIVR